MVHFFFGVVFAEGESYGAWLGLLLIARITCEPCSAPLVQALPPESADIVYIKVEQQHF